MGKPSIVVMAAGLGSRYGGLKQVAPVDDQGHVIIDFSIFDALRAGFEKVILVVKPENERDMREVIGRRIEKSADVRYVFQRMDALPKGIEIPQGRTKPWGTAHAVLSAAAVVDEPFAVINADDFYGRGAFEQIFQFLSSQARPGLHAMVGYRLENTLTDNGYVSRGVCTLDGEGYLSGIVERTHIEKRPGGAAFTENGTDYFPLPGETLVSMNLWGFARDMMDEIERGFEPFLRQNLSVNPLKCEYFLPFVPDQLIRQGRARVRVLPTAEKWYGVTYHEDMPMVRQAIAQMKREGIYPEKLWP